MDEQQRRAAGPHAAFGNDERQHPLMESTAGRGTTSQRAAGTRRALRAAAAVLATGALGLGVAVSAPSTASPDATGPSLAPAAVAGYRVTASSPEVAVGDAVTVTVEAQDVEDLYAYELAVEFDPDVLSYVPDSAATDVSGSTYEIVRDGELDVVHTKLGSSPASSGEVDLASLTFTAVAPGAGAVTAARLVAVSSANETRTVRGLGSAAVSVMRMAAPVATASPRISGTPRVGGLLRASGGGWDVDDVTLAHQWLRAGSPIVGATTSTYRPVPADAGKRLSVRVTASAPDRATGSATSARTAKVAPARTTTTIRLTPARPSAGQRVTALVTVSAGALAPRGAVKVVYDGRVVRTERLRDGSASVVLPAGSRGRHQLRAVFVPRPGFATSRKVRTVRVGR